MPKTSKNQSLALQRLKNEYPEIHADLVAGRIASLKKALAKAGLQPRPNAAEKLLKAWGKANGEEREQFLARIGATRAAADQLPVPTEHLIANGRYLLPQTVKRIEAIMAENRMSPADIMKEAGFPAEGRSLTLALARNASLRLAVVTGLQDWLEKMQR